MLNILLLAVGLAMDAFAVAICKGLAMRRCRPEDAATVGLWFGGFQGIMPVIGFLLAAFFQKYIEAYDHWIAFVLLLLIGANMIKEALTEDSEESADPSLTARVMFPLAIATSIDALAAGIALSSLGSVPIWLSALTIAAVTCLIAGFGVFIGAQFGSRFQKWAEIFGGIVLILLGYKTLAEHMGLFPF